MSTMKHDDFKWWEQRCTLRVRIYDAIWPWIEIFLLTVFLLIGVALAAKDKLARLWER